MKTIKIRKTGKSIKKANELIMQGYDVVLDFGKKADLEKMDRILTYFDDEYGIEVSFRHAEIEEILENSIVGAISGAGAGILYGMIFGGPVGLLALAGGAVGLILGGLSPVLSVTVYRYNGHTLMKIKNNEQ